MKIRIWNLAVLLIFVSALIVMFVSMVGCQHTDVTVPFNAPLMLSQDETIHSPYCRQHGQWVQVNGTVTRHKGDVVIQLPATQPAVPPVK